MRCAKARRRTGPAIGRRPRYGRSISSKSRKPATRRRSRSSACANATARTGLSKGVVGLACRGVFLKHRDKVTVVAAFAEKVLKHGTTGACADIFVALFQFGFELRKFLGVGGEGAADMPSIDRW